MGKATGVRRGGRGEGVTEGKAGNQSQKKKKEWRGREMRKGAGKRTAWRGRLKCSFGT